MFRLIFAVVCCSFVFPLAENSNYQDYVWLNTLEVAQVRVDGVVARPRQQGRSEAYWYACNSKGFKVGQQLEQRLGVVEGITDYKQASGRAIIRLN